MDNLLSMHEIYCPQNLLNDISSIFLTEVLDFHNPVKKLSSFANLTGYKIIFSIFHYLVNLHYARVWHFLKHLKFRHHEFLKDGWLLDTCLSYCFKGTLWSCALSLCYEDSAERASSKLFTKIIYILDIFHSFEKSEVSHPFYICFRSVPLFHHLKWFWGL